MRSVSLGSIRIDIAGHGRVLHNAFSVSEVFELDVFAGEHPLNLYPNGGHIPTNRLVIYWHGQLARPLFDDAGRQTGTRRGADFRSQFWPAVTRRIGKALLAEEQGVRAGAISDIAVETNPGLRSLLSSQPLSRETHGLGLDEFARTLGGGDHITLLEAIPQGTVANIDVDYDATLENGTSRNTSGSDIRVDFNGTVIRRAALRFPLGTIPGGSTVNDSSLQLVMITGQASITWDINAYDGNSDPAADSHAIAFAKTASGTTYVDNWTGNQAAGSVSADLGPSADAAIQSAIAAGRFSLGIRSNQESTNAWPCRFRSLEHGSGAPATLTIDYTSGGGLAPLIHYYRQRRN